MPSQASHLSYCLLFFLLLLCCPLPSVSAQAGVAPLAQGAPVEGQLAGGEAHLYSLTVTTGQYVQLVLDQQGVDVVLTLSSPDGKKLAEVDGPNAMYGPERLAFIAEAAGDYRLDVRPYRKTAPSGLYRLTVEAVREPEEKDRTRVRAQELLVRGAELWAEGSADSLKAALPKCEESLTLWTELGDRWGQADALYYLGEASRLSGDSARGLDYLKRQLAVRRELGDRRGEVIALNNMGQTHTLTGEFEKALEYFKQAIDLGRAINHEELGSFLQGTGTVHLKLGEYEYALYYFGQALPLFRNHGFRNLEASSLYNTANAYHGSGDLQRALDYYQQALSIVTTLKAKRTESNILDGIGVVYSKLGETQKAEEFFQRSLTLSREAGYLHGEAGTLSRLGELYLWQGDVERALASFNQALPIQRTIRDRVFEEITLAGMARAEARRGNLESARRHIEAALEIVESLRSNVSRQGLRSTYLASKQGYYELYVGVLMRLHARQPTAGFDAMAFQASERARARSLLETIEEARANIRQGADPALLERENRLQRQINDKADRLTNMLGGKHDAAAANAAARELDSLLNDYQETEGRIRATGTRYAAITQPQPLSVSEVQAKLLDPDTILLEYSLGAERSYMWLVAHDSVSAYELPRRVEVEEAARRFYELLTTRNRVVQGETPELRMARTREADAQLAEASLRLSRMILQPAAGKLKAKRILIVADGALQYVPLAALQLPGATGGTPLVARHEIISLPSASTLAALRREGAERSAAPRGQKALAVFADPVFAADDQRVKLSLANLKINGPARAETSPGAQGTHPAGELATSVRVVERSAREAGVERLERLYFSSREADAIASFAPASGSLKAVGFAANKAMVTGGALGEYRIVHFATHGLINTRRPELSGIVLALVDEHGRPRDGFLRLHEIYNLKLNTELVVLSACQTALGREVRGEGLVGLARGFMYAGSPRVVASLWKVDDRATAELMTLFYRAMLGQKLPPAAALRRAQAEMSKKWPSPYYWAGFTLQGEWK